MARALWARQQQKWIFFYWAFLHIIKYWIFGWVGQNICTNLHLPTHCVFVWSLNRSFRTHINSIPPIRRECTEWFFTIFLSVFHAVLCCVWNGMYLCMPVCECVLAEAILWNIHTCIITTIFNKHQWRSAFFAFLLNSNLEVRSPVLYHVLFCRFFSVARSFHSSSFFATIFFFFINWFRSLVGVYVYLVYRSQYLCVAVANIIFK